jgi:acetyl CoA:N6-hydroxylysine acetyl transferase
MEHHPTPVHAATLQLLLNLYLREYQDWYYLDIEPQYDPGLKAYMSAQPETKFVRINLKQQELVIYYPLAYHSLCGMHEGGRQPALLSGIEETLQLVTPEHCLQLIINEISENTPGIETISEGLPEKYFQLINPAHPGINQEALFSFMYQENQNSRVIPADAFCREYSTASDDFPLTDIVIQYALSVGLSPAAAVNSWLRRYFEITLNAVLQLYYSHNLLVAANYRNIYLQLDNNGFPEKIYFDKHSLIPTSPGTRSPRIQKEHEEQILLHTFSLHFYCLIRNTGRYGLQEEEKILALLHDTLGDFTSLYPEAAFLTERKRVPVLCCLDYLMDCNNNLPYLKKEIQVHNHVINIPYYSKKLIKPETGTVLHRRYFEGGDLELSLRAFDITQDIPLFHDWVNREYAKKFWQMDGPIKGLEREYIKHLGVDYSHPYVGMLNQTPFCTIELYWTPKDEVGKYYPFHPGDYGFHMLVAPAERRIRNLSTYILATAMEYFFSFPQVNRMIGEADVNHQGTHNLITKVGCEFERSLELPYKTSNLTFCNRQQFQKATQDIFRNSKKSLNIVNY